jgi:hypothetical protein
MWKYFTAYPQFIIGPMFSPIMFEGIPPNSNQNCKHPLRIWKLGSIINSLFIGCLPSIILLVSEHVRGVSFWDFDYKYQENTSLFKSSYGNTIFASLTLTFFLFLTLIVFLNNTIFNCSSTCSKGCNFDCCQCTEPCLDPEINDSSNNADDEDLASEPGNIENIALKVFYNSYFLLYLDIPILSACVIKTNLIY